MATYVQLFGGAGVRLGSRWQRFTSERPYQLLAYLAYQGEWVSREQLAYLFWSDHTDEAARRNLRKTIFKLRHLEWLESIEIENDRLRWQVDTDVASFNRALQEEAWQEVAELYRGLFLQEMETKAAGEFATWLSLERTRLHNLYHDAVLHYANQLRQQNKAAEALPPLERLLGQDEFNEEALRMQLTCLIETGKQGEARSVYEVFSDKLQKELGLEPGLETRQLAEALQNETVTIKRFEPSNAAKPTFISTTSFVGRGHELNELSDLLRQSDCRLLTLLGPGGVGKTRLALQLAEQLTNHDQEGVYIVRLEAIQHPDLIASTIAETLGFTLRGAEAPETQLQRYLANKEVLLVLDNFEQLVSGASLLSSLLAACPKLKLLVTSRERLHLEEEWLLPLEGLSYPQNAQVTLEEVLNYDAIQLFVQRAKQVQPRFTLTENDLPQLVEIVQRLEGFPLGIELSAVWVRHLSLHDIAKEIRENTDFLQSQNRNVSERQQSVRATFEYSWKLLTSKEQNVLAKLSLFHGGFSKEAATFVESASLVLLTSLVDKSLLRIRTGRYDFHELIRQYAAEKLSDKEREATLARHATFYAEFVATREKDVQGGAREVTVLDDLELELSNIRLAWHHAIKRGLTNVFDKMMPTLMIFYTRRVQFREGEEITRLATEHLNESITLGRSLAYQAYFSHLLHQTEQALPLAEKSLVLLETHHAKPDWVAYTLWLLSNIHQQLGESSAAQRFARKSLEYSKRGKNPFLAARSLLALSHTLRKRDAARAEGYLKDAISYFREADDKWGLGLALRDLGDLLAKQRRWAEVKTTQEEGIRVYKFFGRTLNLAELLTEYGMTLYAEGNYEEALNFHQQSLAIYRDYPTPETFYPLKHLGETHLALGEARKALGYFLQAFHFAFSFDEPHTFSIILGTAEALVGLNELEKAALLSYFALTRADPELSERAKSLLKRLEADLPATTLHTLRDRVASWQWADVATLMSSLQT